MNLPWCATLLDGLAAAGVRRAVISPGSRSTPLALAALRHPDLTCRVVLDERSAAFLALGLAKAEGRPAVVIATSGSAVANWHPAVIEADLGRVPLILLSADRPPELQGCGANQTIDQTKIFGASLRAFHALPPAEPDTAWLRSLALRVYGEAADGPVQVNVPLREPLVPEAPSPPAPLPQGERGAIRRAPLPLPLREREGLGEGEGLRDILSARPGLIVCGTRPVDPAPVRRLAQAVGAPILADPLSGLRTEDGFLTVMTRYDALLRHPEVPAPEWILRLGGEPVSKFVGRTLARLAGVPQIVVSADSRWSDPHHTAHHVVIADPGALCDTLADVVAEADPGWLAHWQVMDQLAMPRVLPEEGAMIRDLAHDLPPGTTIFTGNSLAVRQFDWFMGLARRGVRVLGNRGASGIDGNVSTWLGIAAVCRPSIAVIGDLTLLHDLTALQAAHGIDGVLVVVNNQGGGIFDHLPQAALPEYTTAWLTPHAIDLGRAARLFGLRHARVTTGEAAAALALEALERPGLEVIELAVDRAASLAAHRAWFQAVEALEVVSVQ